MTLGPVAICLWERRSAERAGGWEDDGASGRSRILNNSNLRRGLVGRPFHRCARRDFAFDDDFGGGGGAHSSALSSFMLRPSLLWS